MTLMMYKIILTLSLEEYKEKMENWAELNPDFSIGTSENREELMEGQNFSVLTFLQEEFTFSISKSFIFCWMMGRLGAGNLGS